MLAEDRADRALVRVENNTKPDWDIEF
jgi:hypothetical protein